MSVPADKKQIIENLLLSQSYDIPVFHEIALRLQQMMNDHSYRIEEAIKLVNEDPALASEMLRYANTTYNSGKAPITTIKNAVIRLGSQQVVNLAFTASMANSKSDNPVINTYLKKLWQHSHAVAITSAWLAVQVGHDSDVSDINADEVYLAGLFHDIGKLYVLKLMDGLIGSGELQVNEGLIDDILDDLNTPLGIKVMEHWSIPQIYINALERHTADNWKSGTNDYLVAAVRLSCRMHQFVEKKIEITDSDDVLGLFEDELSLLEIDDISYVYNMVKAIS